MTEFIPSTEMLNGCIEPTAEDILAFATYAESHTSNFHVLGAEQYAEGQIVPFDDPILQKWLDERIEYASQKRIKIIQPAECFINQSKLGSCSGASGTSGQMCSIYNHRYFGIPALFERLNCSIAYLKARGRWGGGLAISAMQRTLMEFGNASVKSAGEYSIQAPRTIQGFDNLEHQIWTTNCENKKQVVKFLKAGVAVAFGSHTCPQIVRRGRAISWRKANHAMQCSGYNHDTNNEFFGLYRWHNTWGKIYDDLENGWGCWLDDSELDRFSMFGRFGLPYAIFGAEFKLGISPQILAASNPFRLPFSNQLPKKLEEIKNSYVV